MNRWRMHKLGFVNFWLYDVEEFPLEDGHILMRGANGSGKSISTQSFIPFLLDGNKSPERLDPFGSRDRRMEFYLLGDGDRDESTGYLYLEFKKDELEDYLTIGIGMRAQRGKGIDFWGFCLCDGRRIGPAGIQLYQTIGGQLLPLSKQKLKNIINDDNNWTESQSSYKQLVNERLFQFRDIRQYDQLIQLLIKVRAPKLSKDAFRPSEVKKILNDSLQVLTDEDLSAMVSTMERMDALSATLQDHHTAMRDAVTIRNEYTRYNQFILGLKGQAYLESLSKLERLQNKLKDVHVDLESKKKELQEQSQKSDESDEQYKRAKMLRAAMGEDDISEKRRQLEADRTQGDQLEKQLSIISGQFLKIKDGISKKEVELRGRTRECDDSRDELHMNTRKLDEYNEILVLGNEHTQYSSLIKSEQLTETCQQTIKSILSQRKKQLQECRDSLRQVKQAQTLYDSACQALDQAAAVLAAAQGEQRSAEQQELEERDRLVEAIALCQSINKEFLFSESDLLALRQAVARYHSPADWSSVRQLADDCYAKWHKKLVEELLTAERALRDAQENADTIRKEFDRIRSQPEPVPPRSGQVEATRALLAMRGIPCVPFYETIDFRPGLSSEERDLLETQLIDAGLMDALVVSEENKQQLINLLDDYPDRFLIPGHPVEDPITTLIPDSSNPLYSVAARCLQGISCSDLTANTALFPDGTFRNGAIRGRSFSENPAGYVGTTARKANRERQLHILEEQLDKAEHERAENQEKVDLLKQRLNNLSEEHDSMPTTADLDQALDLLNQTRQAVDHAEKEKLTCANAEQEAKCQVAQLEQESRDRCRGLPYQRTEEAYEEALEAANDYDDVLQTLYRGWNKLQYAVRSAEELENYIAEQRDHADSMQKQQISQQRMLEAVEAKIKEIQEFLNRPESRLRAQKLAELDDEIERQEKKHQEARERCATLRANIENVELDESRSKEELLAAEFQEHDLESYFSEDLSLGLIKMGENLSLSQSARQAHSRIQASDRERTPEKVGDSLRNNFQQHNNSLLKYMPKIETVFDPPSRNGMLRQRLVVTLQKDGKELSLYNFIGELQKDIELTEMVLEQKDRELFEDILTDTISHKLRARIEESQQWSRDMGALMKALDTSMGIAFSLDWKAKKAEGTEELDTIQLVMLLNKDRALLTREDSQRVSAHFRAKLKKARERAEEQEQAVNYADLIRGVLDYRTWYEFQLYYQRIGEAKRDLTDRIFNTFSGGEKAMAIYLPQFAAVSAQYQKGSSSCPMLLALDEAFAGVDDKNIDSMFDLVHTLQFDYIMNSQALWGCYSCVSSLDIAEFHRPGNAQVVTILHYRWNGKEKTLLEG